MTLPRRLPWRTREIFEEVFNLLFRADGDTSAQTHGIQHINVWISRGCCPQAAEATAGLLSVIQRDVPDSQASTSIFHADLRLAYAMALTRFVNGTVDPAQQGAYARSIAAIAQQLGLPLWFVEVRHASTHEDLPSLQILRSAARNALDWLYQNYWMPQIGNGEGQEEASTLDDNDRQRLTTLVLEYKALQKDALRDLSQSDHGGRDHVLQNIDSLLEEIDHKLARSHHSNSISAVQYLAELLMDPGYLVPLSKKKRCSPLSGNKASQPVLPDSIRDLWLPLLERVTINHSDCKDCLLWAMFETQADLSSSSTHDPEDALKHDKSYNATIVAWLLHLLSAADDADTQNSVLRQCMLHPNISTDCVADYLVKQDTALQSYVRDVRQIRRAEPALIAPIETTLIEDALKCMQDRLYGQLRAIELPKGPNIPSNDGAEVVASEPGGWALVDKHAWSQCSMGTLPGGVLPSLSSIAT